MNEELVRRNVLAIKQHSEETRKMVKELETNMNTIQTINQKIILLESQLQALQVKIFSGGATNDNIN